MKLKQPQPWYGMGIFMDDPVALKNLTFGTMVLRHGSLTATTAGPCTRDKTAPPLVYPACVECDACQIFGTTQPDATMLVTGDVRLSQAHSLPTYISGNPGGKPCLWWWSLYGPGPPRVVLTYCTDETWYCQAIVLAKDGSWAWFGGSVYSCWTIYGKLFKNVTEEVDTTGNYLTASLVLPLVSPVVSPPYAPSVATISLNPTD